MKLKEGQKAIDFTTTDIYGKEVKLSNYKGKKIILSFMRNVSCPFCNVRVHQLMGTSVALEHSGVQMILLFESSAKKLKSSVLHKGILPWPTISDENKKIYKTYSVEKSMLKTMRTMVSGNISETMRISKKLETTEKRDLAEAMSSQIPADLFINQDFTVAKAYYGKHADDHINLDELKKFAGIRIF